MLENLWIQILIPQFYEDYMYFPFSLIIISFITKMSVNNITINEKGFKSCGENSEESTCVDPKYLSCAMDNSLRIELTIIANLKVLKCNFELCA